VEPLRDDPFREPDGWGLSERSRAATTLPRWPAERSRQGDRHPPFTPEQLDRSATRISSDLGGLATCSPPHSLGRS
jgi:hypothetical protein